MKKFTIALLSTMLMVGFGVKGSDSGGAAQTEPTSIWKEQHNDHNKPMTKAEALKQQKQLQAEVNEREKKRNEAEKKGLQSALEEKNFAALKYLFNEAYYRYWGQRGHGPVESWEERQKNYTINQLRSAAKTKIQKLLVSPKHKTILATLLEDYQKYNEGSTLWYESSRNLIQKAARQLKAHTQTLILSFVSSENQTDAKKLLADYLNPIDYSTEAEIEGQRGVVETEQPIQMTTQRIKNLKNMVQSAVTQYWSMHQDQPARTSTQAEMKKHQELKESLKKLISSKNWSKFNQHLTDYVGYKKDAQILWGETKTAALDLAAYSKKQILDLVELDQEKGEADKFLRQYMNL